MHPRLYSLSFLLILLLTLTACGDSAASPTTVPTQADTVPTEGAAESSALETGSVAPRYFTIVPAESSASYSVQEEFLGQNLGLTEAVGLTNEVAGTMELTIDTAAGTVAVGENEITVNIESLDSDEARRDERIRVEWLESSSYPIATFVATGIEGLPEGAQAGQTLTFQLVGDLTIRDVTQPVTFDTTATLGTDTLTGEATALIYMRDFGFDPPNVANIVSVTDGVTVKIIFSMQES